MLMWSDLDHLAKLNRFHPNLWEWINDRGDWRKQPSVTEQYDILLKTLVGKSLKEEPYLWDAFANLKGARNSFLHEGTAMIGKKKVTAEDARTLIEKAKAILFWVEKLLPVELQLPKLSQPANFELSKPMFSEGMLQHKITEET